MIIWFESCVELYIFNLFTYDIDKLHILLKMADPRDSFIFNSCEQTNSLPHWDMDAALVPRMIASTAIKVNGTIGSSDRISLLRSWLAGSQVFRSILQPNVFSHNSANQGLCVLTSELLLGLAVSGFIL